jgi:hypothetical protein
MPQLVVQSVMNTQTLREIVIVTRARTGVIATVSGGIGDDEPVLGANVMVMAPNGRTMIAAKHDPDCDCAPGMYTFYPSRNGVDLSQGGTYTLHVRTASGEEVSGSTTIPTNTSPLLAATRRVFFRSRDTLRLSWPRIPGARSYQVTIGAATNTYQVFTDTSITMAGTALTVGGEDIFPVGPVDALVNAVDVNYYEYYRAQSDPFAGAPPTNLVGAVGVFGSVVPMLIADLLVR